ncbi:putative bifunctional diguanylate cyclase/phosphodiesterase [Thauera sp. SDU_THAU2]|uniref:putative bifunctional diguanylate cyclase/phosphodiesterase n=1 Tax=Thauera sp. SDU_THAU2 TaxID=3136633 RepID=UPI0031200716
MTEDSEGLRETLVDMRRELDMLRIETTHAKLLLSALEAMLGANGDDDPFNGVFTALMQVFEYAHAIVLVEPGDGGEQLECIASSHQMAIGSLWPAGKLFRKALSGRIISTVPGVGADAWPAELAPEISCGQPALYFPLAVRGSRGLMILLRRLDQAGFDRSHVALARKFSLLASHAFAARQASLSKAESRRLKDLTEELEASQEALRFRANHDQLTGLPNRAYVRELVDQMIGRKQWSGAGCEADPGSGANQLALAFIDLDEFKRVNDMHGHVAGDVLLQEIARRVQAEIRRGDVFGRISGDEFVIVLDPAGEQSGVARIVERILERIRQPLSVEGAQIKPSASIGIAFYPEHGRDYETLRRHADLAMYQAKTSTKGRVSFFTRDLGREVDDRLVLEQRVKEAVAAGEFRCALQQKINIRTGCVVGFEALARWVDAAGVVYSPGHFLPTASRLGLLDEISALVMEDLLQNLPALDAGFGPAIRYSINVSPAQTTSVPFMQKLLRRLSESGRAGRFILELTEESFAATGPFQTHVLPALRNAGVAISIDDFGTGYSSLAKLAELTVDELKLDRSLVSSIHRRPRNQIVLRAVESLGAALNMSIVAEGIETDEENRYLLEQTCIAIGQGFLHHRPQLLADLLGR